MADSSVEVASGKYNTVLQSLMKDVEEMGRRGGVGSKEDKREQGATLLGDSSQHTRACHL